MTFNGPNGFNGVLGHQPTLKSQIFVADNDSKQQYIANNASFQIIYPCNVADVFVVVIGFGVWVHVSENILLFLSAENKNPDRLSNVPFPL